MLHLFALQVGLGYSFACVSVRVCVCVCVHACVCMCVHTCMHAFMCVCACMHPYIPCVCECMCACVCVCFLYSCAHMPEFFLLLTTAASHTHPTNQACSPLVGTPGSDNPWRCVHWWWVRDPLRMGGSTELEFRLP